jgi:hypothetical protein
MGSFFIQLLLPRSSQNARLHLHFLSLTCKDSTCNRKQSTHQIANIVGMYYTCISTIEKNITLFIVSLLFFFIKLLLFHSQQKGMKANDTKIQNNKNWYTYRGYILAYSTIPRVTSHNSPSNLSCVYLQQAFAHFDIIKLRQYDIPNNKNKQL